MYRVNSALAKEAKYGDTWPTPGAAYGGTAEIWTFVEKADLSIGFRSNFLDTEGSLCTRLLTDHVF